MLQNSILKRCFSFVGTNNGWWLYLPRRRAEARPTKTCIFFVGWPSGQRGVCLCYKFLFLTAVLVLWQRITVDGYICRGVGLRPDLQKRIFFL